MENLGRYDNSRWMEAKNLQNLKIYSNSFEEHHLYWALPYAKTH